MNEQICLSLFDIRLGPQVMYARGINIEEAKNVAMKSILALTGEQKIIEHDVEGILPLPDRDAVFYAYIFPIQLKDEARGVRTTTAALAFIIPRSEASNLYQNVAMLQHQAKQVTKALRNTYIYEPGSQIPKEYAKQLNDWDLHRRIFVEDPSMSEKVIIEPINPDQPSRSLNLFFKLLRRDHDKIVQALIQGTPLILVADDPVLINTFIGVLEIFVSHRLLNIKNHTSFFVDPSQYDIIGIPRSLIANYTRTNCPQCTIVDLEKENVIQGRGNPYIRKFLREAQKLPTGQAEVFIEMKIKQNVLHSIELVDSALDPEKGAKKIQQLQKTLSKDEFNLVMEIALTLNPATKSLEKYIRKGIEQAFASIDEWLG